jgi:hypothetical protein
LPVDRSKSRPNWLLSSAKPRQLGAQGEHLFDPGIGQLIKLWGFQADEFKAANYRLKAEIKAWLASKPSIADLTISENTITSRNRQVALDFGGYLKGVALDRAAAILRSQGIDNALINIGGNVMALGSKEGRPGASASSTRASPVRWRRSNSLTAKRSAPPATTSVFSKWRQALRPPARPAHRLPG